ncbi:hypothetical protein [Kribbella alba]
MRWARCCGAYELSLDDFEGYEIRNVTRPDVVRQAYFAVGVDCEYVHARC